MSDLNLPNSTDPVVLSKMKDPELVDFLQETSRRRMSVVLYALREKSVSVRRSTGGTPTVRLLQPIRQTDAMDRLEADLERLGLSQRARQNVAGQVFVLEVTRRQLLAVAELPSVMCIRPNRWVLPTQNERFIAGRLGLRKGGEPWH